MGQARRAINWCVTALAEEMMQGGIANLIHVDQDSYMIHRKRVF
jgi:hypothetical protein